ncbi:MAG: chitooligosaccharide deacetylase [Sulfobacillus thermosulfidooxidans]|nr:MAG: chitooligosaccharide deacetylase [Sulfobacillus thermosulfidooxidans]
MGHHAMNGFFVISLRGVFRHWKLAAALMLLIVGLSEWHALHAASARGGTNPAITWYVPTDQKVVALTFDDGPWRSSTPQILRILVHHHALATFFVIGQQVLRDPDIIRQEVKDHMEIGNHTFSHMNLAKHSYAQIVSDLSQANQAIKDVTGHPPTLLRTPYGTYNPTVLRAAQELHLRVIMWSWTEDTRDWANPGVEAIVSRVVSHIQPGDIVLFHDGGSDRSQTIAALPIILKDLALRGYRFVTVSQLLTQAQMH